MWITRARSVLPVVALAAAATFGSAGTAQAALYTGNWDPSYGGIFPSLGWSASALIDVPDTCRALGTGNDIAIAGPCAGVDVLSAKVSFYNVANPAVILESFNTDTKVISSIDLVNGDLSGIDTGFFTGVVPTLAIAGNGMYSFSLILFNSTKAQLVYAKPIGTSPGCASPGFEVPGASCGISANAANGVFAPAIPEPETYALMLAGLGALGFVARRRRRG